jgi:prepilin-type N-terminal cleavage/methylation domain-containing protein
MRRIQDPTCKIQDSTEVDILVLGCRVLDVKPRGGVFPSRGFTLIELLVAFTLAALLAGTTFSILASTGSRSRALAADAALHQRAQAVLALVCADLEGAFVPPEAGVSPFFVGREDYWRDRPACRVDLLTTAAMPFDPSAPFGDLAEVGYRLSFADDGPGVLYRREEAPPRDPEGEGGENVEVCRDVDGFSLRYFDGRDWYPGWDAADAGSPWSRGRIPREVAVGVTLRAPDGRSVTASTRVALPMAGARP